MRRALHNLGTPDHLGLAYDAWAPVDKEGKVADGARATWFSNLEGISVSPDYSRSYARWEKSFSAPGDRVFKLQLASRLLVGHGNSSATDVGLTVHHTWGVPVIPGSALKGLVAHYVDAVYGPSDPDRPPWEQDGDERVRADYQGVTRDAHGRVKRGPGVVYRKLFGAPDAEEDQAMRERDIAAGAAAGLVLFHDALYVPQEIPDDKPFAADVLTVHQKSYYDSSGKVAPNDYDSPNPVTFLTIRPGARFLFALSGPPDWTELAEHLLRDALLKWGAGGKTSAGYGRFVAPGTGLVARPAPTAAGGLLPRAGDRVEATLLEERTKKGGWKARHEPSGLSGPIHNSGDVPAEKKAGDRLTLEVASVTTQQMAFRFPSAAPVVGSEKKRKKN
ncbi:MAG: type III-B CRISPR module RAMP protein Cmr6 [Gemmatimonadaceae bacterium]|nr:type III-B CRISPR module RAMP protein Cmr6 [Gemmatimonadaceae bacterium]